MAQQPLWSDDEIREAIRKAARELVVYDTKLADFVLPDVCHVVYRMRDEYEAKLATYRAEIGERDELIADLKGQLTEARTRLSGTEAAWEEVESLMFGEDDA